MKWIGHRLSDNVEIDCLGKDVNLKSPEASAAIKCQQEVAQLRQNFVQNVKSENPEDAYKHAFIIFNADQHSEDKKAENQGTGFLSGFSIFGDNKVSTDSYAERTEKFADYLTGYSNVLAAKNNPAESKALANAN